MRVTSLHLHNFRSFVDSGLVPLDQVNVLIGANNAGKSSLIRALHLLQTGNLVTFSDVRSGATTAVVDIEIAEVTNGPRVTAGTEPVKCTCRVVLSTADRRGGSMSWNVRENTSSRDFDFQLPNIEPNHFIVPFLSRRKTTSYSEDVREQHAMGMTLDMSNLAAKLSRVSNPQFPMYQQYERSCKAILGFVVTSIPSVNGQQSGIYLPSQDTVALEQMGDGVPNIVQLLVNLAISKGKLFLIEEPENDLHPHALKALLDLIVESSKENQFVVSTHSNIVMTHLGSAPNSQLYRVSATIGELPTSAKVELVEATPQARLSALAELGYAFSDLGLWEGWLILEESSAERIIRDYLIPTFAPRLRRLRTIAAGGVGNVEPSFADLNRLTLFAHLQPAYLGRTWVLVDGDENGRDLIKRLREKYPVWPTNAFETFSKPQFELYYPAPFSEKVEKTFAIPDVQARRNAKRDLLLEVTAWLDADPDRGKLALGFSAAQVIEELQSIEKTMFGDIDERRIR